MGPKSRRGRRRQKRTDAFVQVIVVTVYCKGRKILCRPRCDLIYAYDTLLEKLKLHSSTCRTVSSINERNVLCSFHVAFRREKFVILVDWPHHSSSLLKQRIDYILESAIKRKRNRLLWVIQIMVSIFVLVSNISIEISRNTSFNSLLKHPLRILREVVWILMTKTNNGT
ncbi:uncharacterized protein LOC108742055 [Agrilus planipennis]|uniref:Uncharacterized protein LOC108742055 n=1 Tax=Agrilus planipennis TaxID=224129 RepID=A0A1W4XIF4_AGRPL|nr:uncharacterized protein LOC108742055 [Agrilus planipennis]